MNAASLTETVALGAITGMRSMAGPATLAITRGGLLRHLVPVMALGEMIADKTSLVGNRIDAVPLAGRAVMGGLVGGVIARERRNSVLLGALVGASAAVVVANLAFRARTRLPFPSALSGLLEDALVAGVAAFYGRVPSAATQPRAE